MVSAEYLKKLPTLLSKSLKPNQTDGEGYTETGLRFGPGWIERVAGRSTGILDLKARVPQLENAQQLAFDEVSVIRKGLDQLCVERERFATALKDKKAEIVELEKNLCSYPTAWLALRQEIKKLKRVANVWISRKSH